MRKVLVACLLLFGFGFNGAKAASIDINFSQVGSNVVGSYSGSVNLTFFTLFGPGNLTESSVNPGNGSVRFAGDTGGPVDFYQVTLTPVSFGQGFGATADQSTGDAFAIFSGIVFLPVGYVSNTEISGTMTFLNSTLDGLGLKTDFSSFSRPDALNTFNVSVDAVQAVPLPFTLPLFVAALAAFTVVGRRRS